MMYNFIRWRIITFAIYLCLGVAEKGMGLPNQLLLVLFHRSRGHVEHHHLHIQLIDHRHLGNVATEEL